ncbi:PKD domain protein [uncultured archaeon]|nr:PKD domain protein [uncultured archaeon]
MFVKDGIVGSMKKYRRGKKMTRGSVTVLQVFLLVFSVVFFSSVNVVKAAPTVVSINRVSHNVSAGHPLNITVMCSPQLAIKAFELKVSFNPSLLQATAVSEGHIFDGFTTFFNKGYIINNSAGTIVNIYDLIVGPGTVTDTGSLVLINFTARSLNRTSTLGLYDVRVTNESEYVAVSVSSGAVMVTGGSNPPPVNPPPSGPPSNPPSSDNTPPSLPLQPIGGTHVNIGIVYSYSSAARDPDGDLVRLRFDWGDGSLSNWTAFVTSNTSVYASHAWVNISNCSIRVIAQDTTGVNSSWSDPLTVMVSQNGSGGSPPVGVFTVPENASSNQTIVFNASGVSDPDGMIVSYQWDFGDGTTGVGENPVHTYQLPGTYTVTLTVIDNTGMTVIISKVMTILAGSEAQTGTEKNFFQSNSNVIILTAVVIPVLIFLVVFRDKIEKLYVQRRIETSRRRLALGVSNTSEIDQILDTLFGEMKPLKPSTSKETILNAYNDLIVGKVEENTAYRPPDFSIEEIEKLVDRRLQAKIEEEVDKL